MARAWVGLVLLCLVVSQVDGRGGRGGRRGGSSGACGNYCWIPWIPVAIIVFGCLCGACCACQDTAEDRTSRVENDVERGRRRDFMARHQSWQPNKTTATKYYEDSPNQTANQSSMQPNRMTSTLPRVDGDEREPFLAGQRVMVQLVDEQLVNLEVPPAEVTLTTFSKLLSDLTFYSGVPDVEGILVKSESSGYVQVFNMEKIPPGNLKVRAVMSGTKRFLRLYPNLQPDI